MSQYLCEHGGSFWTEAQLREAHESGRVQGSTRYAVVEWEDEAEGAGFGYFAHSDPAFPPGDCRDPEYENYGLFADKSELPEDYRRDLRAWLVVTVPPRPLSEIFGPAG